MLTGEFKNKEDVKKLGMVANFPRFQGEGFEHNLKLVQQVEAVASDKACTPAQLAINWVRNMSTDPELPLVIPIPGATTIARVEENSKVVELTGEDMQSLTGLAKNFETAGARYPSHVPTNT